MSDIEIDREGQPYGIYLLWFMRGVGVIWLAKGIIHWCLILGIGHADPARFLELPVLTQSAVIFFAVFDLVAAVGLWMASAWGGVIWLIAAGAHFAILVFKPEIFGRQYALMATITVLIFVYVALAYLAARVK
ncbi:DUF6163 family protein [Labrys monachus]|jgi:hypothetical protein|uniref:DoxX family protein n=1 Tax=Labrys monachus TaxID=217067 RepID=A0ABU0FL56_9HYPH|nr:DUF6163 family protein [Labrys monachus]MDQ0395102.1 hypothetical protein [Labrys monachus]